MHRKQHERKLERSTTSAWGRQASSSNLFGSDRSSHGAQRPKSKLAGTFHAVRSGLHLSRGSRGTGGAGGSGRSDSPSPESLEA